MKKEFPEGTPNQYKTNWKQSQKWTPKNKAFYTILGPQNGPRNQGKVGGDPMRLFWGGDPQKDLPKVRFLGVFLSF